MIHFFIYKNSRRNSQFTNMSISSTWKSVQQNYQYNADQGYNKLTVTLFTLEYRNQNKERPVWERLSLHSFKYHWRSTCSHFPLPECFLISLIMISQLQKWKLRNRTLSRQVALIVPRESPKRLNLFIAILYLYFQRKI